MKKNIVKNLLLLLYIPIWHFIGIKRRDKNLYVFSSWSGEKYNDNSRLFYEYIRDNYPHIKCVWLLKNQELIEKLQSQNVYAISSYSLEASKILKKAGKIFTVRDDEFSFLKINGAEWYQLWHGMPLKKIKFDAMDGLSQFKKKSDLHYRLEKILHPWGVFSYKKRFTVVNSNFFIPFLASSFNLPESHILKIGSPRCDALFHNGKEPLIERVRNTFQDCKIILYMPTCRNSQWGDSFFNPFIDEYGFNKPVFDEVLKQNNLVFMYKPHFYDSDNLQSADLSSRFIEIREENVNELYNFVGQIDILMTDYSSIYFDFICTKKPVILTPFDYDVYIKNSRQHYFDYYSQMEGIKAKNWIDVCNILNKKDYYPVSSEKIMQFAEYLDGKSCEKLANYIMGDKYAK